MERAMSDHNFIQLRAFICEHSVSHEWATARLEWLLDSMEHSANAEMCPCSHYPIHELCWLANAKTGDRVFVGNVCVNRFMPELDSNAIWQGLKRIQHNADKAATES